MKKFIIKTDSSCDCAIDELNKNNIPVIFFNYSDEKQIITDDYLGTYFIECNVNTKPIYAPLILKEIDIDIVGNDVYLISNSDYCVLNEKLICFKI